MGASEVRGCQNKNIRGSKFVLLQNIETIITLNCLTQAKHAVKTIVTFVNIKIKLKSIKSLCKNVSVWAFI